MPAINDNQFIIDNVLTANEFVFHALDCDKENAHLNVIGRLAISSRGSELVNKITNRIEIKKLGRRRTSLCISPRLEVFTCRKNRHPRDGKIFPTNLYESFG